MVFLLLKQINHPENYLSPNHGANVYVETKNSIAELRTAIYLRSSRLSSRRETTWNNAWSLLTNKRTSENMFISSMYTSLYTQKYPWCSYRVRGLFQYTCFKIDVSDGLLLDYNIYFFVCSNYFVARKKRENEKEENGKKITHSFRFRCDTIVGPWGNTVNS